ncbi:hypothetical protein WG66_005262 [Moniliophthora roreri]|nr:hypothetical protein WG66_005262 [Moniliophthora roreri]
MPNSAVALQMFSTVGSLLPPFMFLPLSCSVVFYGCASPNITPMPHCYSSSQHPTLPNYHPTSSCIQCSAASLEPKPSRQCLRYLRDFNSLRTVQFSVWNHPSLYFKEPPEAPFLMFSPSRGRLVGTVTWAGNKEVTVLIGRHRRHIYPAIMLPYEDSDPDYIHIPHSYYTLRFTHGYST